MQYAVVTAILLVILGYALYRRRKDNTQKLPQKAKPEIPEGDVDLNDKFIDQSGDRPIVKLVRTYTPDDLALLRSILDAAGIESYSEFNYINGLYPGLPIQGFNDAIVSVFADKAEEAKLIVAEYIESLLASNEDEGADTPVDQWKGIKEAGRALASGPKSPPELLV